MKVNIPKSEIEKEVRFGSFKNKKFVPGVSKLQYDDIMEYYKKNGWDMMKISDKVTSRTLNNKKSVRRIENASGTIYQTKEKLKITDVPPHYRVSEARETNSNKVTFNTANNKKNYSVTRNRISFIKGNARVDMTNTGRNYQVEVENSLNEVPKIVALLEYRKLVGPGRVLPLPQTLTLDNFKKRVLTKREYSVTEKADGERYILLSDSEGNMTFIARGTDVKPLGIKSPLKNTIIDGELYKDKFYSFDILFSNGKDVRKKKLMDRLDILYKSLVQMKIPMIRMKNFLVDDGKEIIEMPSKAKTGMKNIYDAANAIWSRRNSFAYPLDGLIFTPVNDVYFSKNIYKWKDENTIDFYYDKNRLMIAGFDKVGGKYSVIPFEGVDGKGTFVTYRGKVKNDIFSDTSASMDVRKGKLSTELSGKGVGEFTFKDNEFKLIRKRPDKEFPNGIEAVNQVWESITSPLTAQEIGVGPGAMRRFHNEIKDLMIQKYAKNKSVIDIGSGKGEDIAKYVKAGSKPVVGFDIVSSEYPHPSYMKFFKMKDEVYDIGKYLDGKKFDVININFAIHYFFKNQKTFKSLVDNVLNNLKRGGVIMGTVLDGRLIYNTLKNKKQVNTSTYMFEKKYENKINFNDPRFDMLGQKIDVLVKGTKYFTKPIAEYLFNFKKFANVMEQNGFRVVKVGNFNEFCNESVSCRRYMTTAEKNYSFKNMYFVLQRK